MHRIFQTYAERLLEGVDATDLRNTVIDVVTALVDGASAEAIAEQVKRCPSGALTYEVVKKAK